MAVQEFLESGGNLYVEMGGMFYQLYTIGYPNRAAMKHLFGVNMLGLSGVETPVDTLQGVASAPTDGMLFTGSDQLYSWHIDKLNAVSGAVIPFNEKGYGNVAIMNTGSASYNYKSFYMGYSLAEIHDRDATSSRYNVLLKTMEFFDYGLPQGYLLSNFITDKTVGGIPLQVQFTDISINDPSYPVTTWQWDFDNDGTIDSDDQNPMWTYNEMGTFNVRLITSNGLNSDTLVVEGAITVNSGFFVYEGVGGGNDYSGSFIRDYLQQKSNPVTYQNKLPESLEGFSAVFLSFGNFESGATPLDDKMANTIIDYLNGGGYVYLEGGDALGFDQADNSQLLGLFGLVSGVDGGTNPIDSLQGQADALTNEMLFTGDSQSSNSYIDRYEPFANATTAFIESNYGTVAVQQSIPGDRRTFCFSYALAYLNDGEMPNTREELLNRILNFFDIYTAVPEVQESDGISCKIYPNPMSTNATIQYFLPEDSQVILEIYNSTGQKIMEPSNGNQLKGEHSVQWNVGGVPAGIYYYSLRSGKQVHSGKIIIIR